jgi:hypothetical protein
MGPRVGLNGCGISRTAKSFGRSESLYGLDAINKYKYEPCLFPRRFGCDANLQVPPVTGDFQFCSVISDEWKCNLCCASKDLILCFVQNGEGAVLEEKRTINKSL